MNIFDFDSNKEYISHEFYITVNISVVIIDWDDRSTYENRMRYVKFYPEEPEDKILLLPDFASATEYESKYAAVKDIQKWDIKNYFINKGYNITDVFIFERYIENRTTLYRFNDPNEEEV